MPGGQQRLERRVPGGRAPGLARDGGHPRRLSPALDGGNEQRRGVLAGVPGVAAALGASDLEHRSLAREVDRRRVELAVPAVHHSEQGVLAGDPHLLADCLTPHVPERCLVAVGPDQVLEGTRIHSHAWRLAAGTDIFRPPCRSSAAQRGGGHPADAAAAADCRPYPPTTQGELPGADRSQTSAGLPKMPIEGSAAPSKLNSVRLTFGEPMPVPGSQGTPGIQSGAQ